ncbi:MAG: ketol-acid reductoisomerase [Candidatus Eisenbacteria bacterium]|nr:ketol-acid reductoisomerase [Candidatus Eisenbacteria bacterium]
MNENRAGRLPLLREADCPLDPLRGLTCAVIGYGNQGRAQALNLRDSGIDVWVGVRPGGAGAAAATADRFTVKPWQEAASAADLAALLTPDETQAAQLEQLAATAGSRLRAVVFAHGFTVRFGTPRLDPAWDVFVVAPAGPGVQVRSRYVEGFGVPAILALHQDASGRTEALARAYAAAIGAARAGVFRAEVAQEAEIDLFGEQAVLCGGMNSLLTAAFDTLTDAGYPPEMAYLECVQQLRLTAELVERFGIEGMRRRISPTALYGDLSRGPRLIDETARATLRSVLAEVRDGRFAREWLGTAARRPDWVREDLAAARNDRLEAAGEVVRQLFRPPSDGPDEGPASGESG